MIQPVPIAELVILLRKRGEIAFLRDYPLGFLEVVYLPPSTEGYQDGDTAGTRLGGSIQSRSLNMEKQFIPLVWSSDNPENSGIRVGRQEDNDIVIDAWGVSKQHGIFSLDDQGQVFLTDLGSANGSTVNGTELTANQPAQLFTGDAVTIWWYVFEFVYTRHLIKSFRELL